MGYMCEVCQGPESALVHNAEEDDEAVTAAGTVADVRLDDKATQQTTRHKGLVDADRFFAVDVDKDGIPDFYVGMDFRADGTPSMITGIFLLVGESWLEWNAKAQSWGPTSDQSDAIPIDDESAYATALLMEDDGHAVPVNAVNPPEWVMTDEARAAIPDYEEELLDSLSFCVVFGETDCDDCGDLAVTELWLKERRRPVLALELGRHRVAGHAELPERVHPGRR